MLIPRGSPTAGTSYRESPLARLIITSREQAGTCSRLVNRPLSIGRDPDREIQIKDPKVSRKHLQVRKEGDPYGLRELKRLNGAIVNGAQREGEQPLEDGDEIKVGDTLMVLLESDDSDRSNALNT